MNPACPTADPAYGFICPGDSGDVLDPAGWSIWFFLFWAGALFVVLVLPWAINALVRRKDSLPILCIVGGTIASLLEPMYDTIAHLRWSPENPMVFNNFGLDIPALIPPCYALFMGIEAYWIYAIIRRGISHKQFMWMFGAVALSDAIMENPGVHLQVYEYYGTQPFKFFEHGFPFYWSFTNAVAICTIGVLVYYIWPRLQRRPWHRLAILAVPPVGMAMGEFGTGFPVFLAINADIPSWLAWTFGLFTPVLALLWVSVLGRLVASPNAPAWTFWGLFKVRFMLPHIRDRYLTEIGGRIGAVSTWEYGAAPRLVPVEETANGIAVHVDGRRIEVPAEAAGNGNSRPADGHVAEAAVPDPGART